MKDTVGTYLSYSGPILLRHSRLTR